MAETTPRVVLLARAGKAADNLADALRQAGADLVAVADPSGLDRAALLGHRPQAVLVALEPGIESAVDALDDVLSSPELTVIFDEADIAAQRAGWDAARWVRHLSAKLHRHQDVLPPGAEPETDMMPSPGQPPTPASFHAAQLDITPFAREAEGRAAGVPADELHPERAPSGPAPLSLQTPDTPAPSAPVGLALDDDAFFLETLSGRPAASAVPLEFADTGLSLAPMAGESMDTDTAAIDSAVMGVSMTTTVDIAGDDGSGFAEEIDAGELSEDELRAFEQAMLASTRAAESAAAGDEPPAFDPALLQDLGFDPALLEPIAPDAPSAPSAAPLQDFDFGRSELSLAPTTDTVAPAPPRAAPPVGLPDFSSLSLADDDAGPLQSQSAPAPTRRQDLSDLEQRISGLSLVDIEPAADEPPALPPVAAPALEEAPLQPRQQHADLDRPYLDTAHEDRGFEQRGFEQHDFEQRAFEQRAFEARAVDPHTYQDNSFRDSPTPPAYVAPEPGPAYAAYTPPPVAPPPVMPPPLPAYQAPPMPAPPVAASATATAVRMLVLVEAGLGGPDPVRQLLAGLPAGFPVPVVVRLQLQGGRYDRLVTQMERAASLPVALAAPDQPLVPGRIHFLPEGVGLRRDGDGLRFNIAFAGSDDVYDTLETLDDGALVFLSGSDPGLVDRAASLAAGGAFVVAQSPEDCYDGVACAQLRSRGVPVAAAPELAARLAQHWLR